MGFPLFSKLGLPPPIVGPPGRNWKIGENVPEEKPGLNKYAKFHQDRSTGSLSKIGGTEIWRWRWWRWRWGWRWPMSLAWFWRFSKCHNFFSNSNFDMRFFPTCQPSLDLFREAIKTGLHCLRWWQWDRENWPNCCSIYSNSLRGTPKFWGAATAVAVAGSVDT